MVLQRADYTLSDFFGDWIRMKRNLRNLPHRFAQYLLSSLERREGPLLNHTLMLSTVYLDPRYNFLLTVQQKETAKAQLLVLWRQIDRMNPEQSNSIEPIPNNDTDDGFANYLREQSSNIQPDSPSCFIMKIESFLNRPPLSYKTNIIEYWKSIKAQEPELYKLVTALFSVPATQASVERCFSSLTYVFNNYRSQMNKETLKEVLILRLNFDMIDQ